MADGGGVDGHSGLSAVSGETLARLALPLHRGKNRARLPLPRAPASASAPAMAKRPRKRSSPAQRFLWVVAGLTMVFIAARLRLPDLRGRADALGDGAEGRVPRGADAGGRDLCPARPVDRAARTSPAIRRCGRRRGSRRRQRRGPRSSSSTRPASSNPPPGTRRSTTRNRSNGRALFVRSQASAFNSVGAVWAPKYRQATFGAFLTSEDNARRALDFAYRDVLAAYEEFLRQAPPDRPIILAAHSQGSLHLMRLLEERVQGAPEARADRRRLCHRLAGLRDRGPARSAPPRLRAARAGALPALLAELRRAGRPGDGHRRLRRLDRPRRGQPRRLADALRQPADRDARRRGGPRGQSRHARPQRRFQRRDLHAAAPCPRAATCAASC